MPGSPGWPKKDPALVERIEAAVTSLPVTKRKMFGSECWFVADNALMFAGTWGDGLVIRLGQEDVEREVAAGTGDRFDPMGDRPMKEYALIPADGLVEDSDLQAWIQRGFDFTAPLPPKKNGNRPVMSNSGSPK